MMEEIDEQNFYCNIIMPVMDDPNLKDKAKLLYGRISSLAKSKGFCWASNVWFADKMNCDPNTISRLVSDLQDGGYITVEILKKEGNKRRIWIDSSYREKNPDYLPNKENLSTKSKRPIYQNKDSLSTQQEIPIYQNVSHNSIDNNILTKPINNKKREQAFSEIGQRVIVSLNEHSGRKYKPTNELYLKHITARLKDGYTEEQLNEIIIYKCLEWKGTKMETHLIPDTLFNKTNANKYRDQVAHAKESGMTASQVKGEKKSINNKW